MKINGLDDQSLLLIFDRLSVENLLRAGRVCSRWNAIRGKAALSRKSLTLLIGPNAVKELEKSQIRNIPNYKSLSNKENNATPISLPDVHEVMNNTQSKLQINSKFSNYYVNFLSQLFANVQHFTISFPDSTANVQLVNDLLVKWTSKLVTLKLFAYDSSNYNHVTTDHTAWLHNRQLLMTINSIVSLRVVHFDVSTPSMKSNSESIVEEDAMFMFGFVKRLTQFYFHTAYRPLSKCLIDCLNMMHVRQNQDHQLSDIAISSPIDDSFKCNHCVSINPELAHCFSQIAIAIDNAQPLEYLSNHFTNLTILHLNISCMPSVNQTLNPNLFHRSMSSLKQLIYLDIQCSVNSLKQLIVEDPTEVQSLYGCDYISSSVQVLRLENAFLEEEVGNHAFYGRLCLNYFFPHTRMFLFDRFPIKCHRCVGERLSYERYCLKRMLTATGMHHQCKLIKTIFPDRNWLKEDFICDDDDEVDSVYFTSDEDDEDFDDEYDHEDENENHDNNEDEQ